MAPDSKKLSLDSSGLAERFGVSIHSVHRWTSRGEIGFIRLGRTCRFSEEHVAAFLTKREHPAAAARKAR